MAEIKTNQNLELENLMSFLGQVRQSELEHIGKDLEEKIRQAGAEKVGYPISATYAVEGEMIDVEILVPINRRLHNIGNYVFKEKLLITNALQAMHRGNPVGLQQTCNQLNQYIIEQKLVPITVGYNVTRRVDMLNVENTEIDVFVGINPNIL